MSRRCVTRFASRQFRRYSIARSLLAVPTLEDGSVVTFKAKAFEPAVPALLPRRHFIDLPAISKWFNTKTATPEQSDLNTRYLSRFGATIVPLEITNADRFARIEHSLSLFLESVRASTSTYAPPRRYFSAYVPGARAVRREKSFFTKPSTSSVNETTSTNTSDNFFSASSPVHTPTAADFDSQSRPTARIYLAQASLADLPRAMTEDVPAPALIREAGRGDVYASSLWLGQAPTYTPLHRDPNPNLFVQLAGRKVVRLLRPDAGHAVFSAVQERIQGNAMASMRGEEMMQGAEKIELMKEVWEKELPQCWEAEVEAGDGLFIPKGWWHSVRGVGAGMTGSVNWWFR